MKLVFAVMNAFLILLALLGIPKLVNSQQQCDCFFYSEERPPMRYDENDKPSLTVTFLCILAKTKDEPSNICTINLERFKVNVAEHLLVDVMVGLVCSVPLSIRAFSTTNTTIPSNVDLTLTVRGSCQIPLSVLYALGRRMALKRVVMSQGAEIVVPDTLKTLEGINNTLETFYFTSTSQNCDSILTLFTQHRWPKMTAFEIKNCSLVSLPDEFERTMPFLQSLWVSYNNLKKPPLFPWNKNILFLNTTRASWIDKMFYINSELTPNTVLRRLDLKENAIEDLKNFRFRGPLHKLVLTGNGLRDINPKCFQNLSGLIGLELGQNNLNDVPERLLNGLLSLVRLYLNHNNLSYLPRNVFRDLIKLKHLYLNNNNLVIIQHGLFSSLRRLEVLHLENNMIKSFHRHINLRNLKDVYLQNNRIKNIPSWILVLPSLVELNMSYNLVTSERLYEAISSNDLRLISTVIEGEIPTKKRKWHLVANKINSINIFRFSITQPRVIYFLGLYMIDLSNNPILCDCVVALSGTFLRQQIWHSKNHFRNWKCARPSRFAGFSIVSDQAKNILCPLLAMPNLCPSFCKCSYRPRDWGIIVDCRSRNLTAMPDVIPYNPFFISSDKEVIERKRNIAESFPFKYLKTTDTGVNVYPNKRIVELYLEKNRIEELPPMHYLKNVTGLYLSYNNLWKIESETFPMMSQIEELYINNNKLEDLPKSIQNASFKKIALHNNVFRCDCNALWIKKWFKENRKIITELDQAQCFSGPGEGMPVIDVPDQDFVCFKTRAGPKAKVFQNFTAAYTVGGVLAPFIVLLLIAYKFRGEIKLLAFIHCNWHPFDKIDDDNADGERIYDAFLSYSRHDCQWVMDVLRERLENNDPPFRLCIHDRDFVVGAPIQENIMASVRQSRRMLLILSCHFIQSEWCLLEFRAAHQRVLKDRTNYLIIILLDELNIEELDEELQLYMRTNTYLSVHNRWFWEKLLYVLPRNPVRGHHEMVVFE